MRYPAILLGVLWIAGLLTASCQKSGNVHTEVVGQTASQVSQTSSTVEEIDPAMEAELQVELDAMKQNPSGRWGRVIIGAAQLTGVKDNHYIKNGYACFYFEQDWTFEYEGVHFGKPFRASGMYSFDWEAGKARWSLTKIIEPENDPEINSLLGDYVGKIGRDENGRRMIENGLFRYVEGVYWDREAACYRDSDGDMLVPRGSEVSETSQMPLQYVGYDGGGWEFQDYTPRTRMVYIYVYESPVESHKAEAKAWLKSKGIEESQYELYFDSPAHLRGGGEP